MNLQFVHTEPGSTFQYFSTTLSVLPDLNSLENNSEASALFLTVMIIADLFPFSDSRDFFSLVLLINQQSHVFNYIPIDNLICGKTSSFSPRQDIALVIFHLYLISATVPDPLP